MMRRTGGNSLYVEVRGDLEIVMTRLFDAPRDLVFEALTKPEHVVRWLGRRGDSMPLCEIDLRVGGRWRYVFQLREGGEMAMNGVFQEVAPPERIVQTETFEGSEFEAMGGGTVNTQTLEDQDGKTLLTTIIRYQTRAARDAVLQTPMEQGVGEGFERLDELLQALLHTRDQTSGSS